MTQQWAKKLAGATNLEHNHLKTQNITPKEKQNDWHCTLLQTMNFRSLKSADLLSLQCKEPSEKGRCAADLLGFSKWTLARHSNSRSGSIGTIATTPEKRTQSAPMHPGRPCSGPPPLGKCSCPSSMLGSPALWALGTLRLQPSLWMLHFSVRGS